MNDPQIRFLRHRPSFPEFEHQGNPVANFFIFLGGILLWLVLIVLFLAALYIHWFSRSLEYLLHTIHSQKTYSVPFWFSLLLTILFFPLTLVILLIAGFVRIIQE